MSWYPVKSGIENGGYAVFRPEAYGTPGGEDASVDTPLVQAAFDAAEAHTFPCYVRLQGTYAIEQTEDLEETIGPYSITYGIWLDADYVIVDGGGTLKTLAEQETTYPYIMFLIGNGGYNLGVDGAVESWEDLKAFGNWTYGNEIRDLTVDNSDLDNDALDGMTEGALAGVIVTAFCWNWIIENVTVTKAWGHGGIVPHCSSIDYTVKDCTIDQYYETAMHCDGSELAVIDNVEITNPITIDVGGGITLATNTDYKHGAANNTIKNCTVYGGMYCIGLGAWDEVNVLTTVQDNTIYIPDGATTRIAINVSVNTLTRSWHTKGVLVKDNAINKLGENAKGWGVYTWGSNTGPTICSDVEITGNTFGNKLAIAWVLGGRVEDCDFHDNTVNCTTYACTGSNCTGNVVDDSSVCVD